MRKKLIPPAIALLFAISIHMLALKVFENPPKHGMVTTTPSDLSLFLLPNTYLEKESADLEKPKTMRSLESFSTYLKNSKPILLDLSSVTLQTHPEGDEVENIFSQELRNKIIQSQNTQQEYLKGQIKTVEYPITEGADGTRYINIQGACWRIPKPGSEEPWAFVVSGCSGQTKTFNFELNINPNLFLEKDSLFFIGQ